MSGAWISRRPAIRMCRCLQAGSPLTRRSGPARNPGRLLSKFPSVETQASQMTTQRAALVRIRSSSRCQIVQPSHTEGHPGLVSCRVFSVLPNNPEACGDATSAVARPGLGGRRATTHPAAVTHRSEGGVSWHHSFLKRVVGLGRCLWSGFTSFRAYLQASVLAGNLLVAARHLLAARG